MSRNADMSGSDRRVDALRARFQQHPVAELGEVCRTLRVSGRTVFRALKKAGYHSSYSHAGRYYTLAGIPTFDVQGLWFHQDVGFSAHGTLRETVERLVEQVPAGHTHEELQTMLRLRVHDTLRGLVEAGRLGRQRVQSLYVYVSAVPDVAGAQLAKRLEHETAPPAAPPDPPLDAARVIDVLLAVIRAPGAAAHAIALGLRARALGVTDAQVEELFTRYALGKKTARSRSRRSLRSGKR